MAVARLSSGFVHMRTLGGASVDAHQRLVDAWHTAFVGGTAHSNTAVTALTGVSIGASAGVQTQTVRGC